MKTFEEWCQDREIVLNELSPKLLTMAYKIWGEDCFVEGQRHEAENAALRERLNKAVELPCKVGDRFYIVEYYPPEIIEEECCDFSFREFPKILLENGCDCTYELGDNGSYFVTFDKNEAKKIFEKLKKEQRND